MKFTPKKDKFKSAKELMKGRDGEYHYDFYKHGVTQSMINLWLTCREQCRLQYVEGWSSIWPSLPLEYGSAMHWLYAAIYRAGVKPSPERRGQLLAEYHEVWKKENPRPLQAALEMHELVRGLARVVLPVYVKRADMKDRHYNDFTRKWVQLEKTFSVEWNGVRLNGQHDGIFIERKGLYVLETKNQSRIDEEVVQDTLPKNLQVMVYLLALILLRDKGLVPDLPIKGVLYNMTRRPELYRRKDEPLKEYLERTEADVNSRKRMDWYFLRFDMQVTEKEVMAWANTTFRRIIEDMKRWWDGISKYGHEKCDYHYENPTAYTTKYGRCAMYNPIVRGTFMDCVKRTKPFPELDL